MKKNKIGISIVSIILMAIICMIIPNKVKAVATDLTRPVNFGVKEFWDDSTPANIAYAIRNPYARSGAEPTISGQIIWQIVKYVDGTSNQYEVGNFYCAKAGIGFSDMSSTIVKEEYNRSYDLRNDKIAISNSGNNVLKSIVDNGYYDNLMALLDKIYLKGVSSDEERTQLLEDAGIRTDGWYVHPLTDTDIQAVQQAAIWYYTNHDTVLDEYEGYTGSETLWDKIYNQFGDSKTSWLNYSRPSMQTSTDKSTWYTSFSDYDNGNHDEEGNNIGAGYERQEQAVILYNYLINYANNHTISSDSRTNVTLYASTKNQNAQPIIEITKTPAVEKEFDLSIRKYITKLDGVEIAQTRNPNIDTSSIESTGTATYKHRKDAVTVTNGTKVTYNLTVYNEGEKAGRATKITDQLADGLEFTRVVTPGFSVENYDRTNNIVTIKRDSNNTTNLPAFDGRDLKSETIEIECIVNATPDTRNQKILTNVAWISEEYDAVDKVTITNQENLDRDSEPSTKPNVNKNNMENYIGDTDNKTDLTDSNHYYKGEQDDDDFERLVILPVEEGKYNVTLVKEDKNGRQLNIQAKFNVNGQTETIEGQKVIASGVEINESNLQRADVYRITEIEAPKDYCKFNGTIIVTVTKKKTNGKYEIDTVTHKVTDENDRDITASTSDRVKVNYDGVANIKVEVKNYQFDLKLVKRIVEVNGNKVPERIGKVDITKLANGTATTADYEVDKTPVAVKKGDIVKYTFRVYNEGDIDGYASEITEDIPEGLEFIWSEKTGSELSNDTSLTAEEKQAIEYNQLRWDMTTPNSTTGRIEKITTDYLAKGNGEDVATDGANLIKAFDPTKGYINTINNKNPDYKEISVYLRVISEDNTNTIIRNEAAITGNTDSDGNDVDDRDSDTEDWKEHPNHEDDEDHDYIILQSFDLALRKFIIAVSNDTTIDEDEYLLESDGKTYTRAPKVDTSKLNTIGEDGKVITTATYEHSKEPVDVKAGDVVVYMLRVYNEGDIDGYASEITDHLPPYLEYIDNEFNKSYGWSSSEDGRTVKTAYLDNHIIGKTTVNDDGKIVLSYKEVPIMCKLSNNAQGKITNIADVTVCKDENKKVVIDRDSQVNNVELPDDNNLPNYKDNEKGSYIPGQQDDDDFEKVIVRVFDLALRKFITGVNDEEITNRIPEVKYENGKITYEHPKTPIDVVTGNTVIYTLRVYNEGDFNGYASKVSDDIPDGLEFLPENELNEEYRWKMYDSEGKETEDISKAVKITTDYLSKEQGEARMENDNDLKENPALLHAFDSTKEISDTNPDYKELKIAFKVVEPTTSDRVIINSAQITDDTDEDGKPIDDIDSTPDEWIEGEDDQDKEYIKLNYFDLALRKWVTHAIVVEDGKETVTPTGHKAEDNPEDVVKVELDRKKINSVTVKFKYSIRITNEGDIEGYAKEITDYVPAGLKFVAEDNPDWTDEGNNIISTRKLENKLLKPGESAEVQVILTWINGNDNLGKKVNIAEISEDYNDKNAPDIDSTPDNKKDGEDDIDDAPVLLSVSTGRAKVYFALGFTVLITLAGGIILIKKYI